VTTLALAQLPRRLRRQVLIRTDSGGGTHDFLSWLSQPGRRLPPRLCPEHLPSAAPAGPALRQGLITGSRWPPGISPPGIEAS
jgi:hypothetical protein